MTSKFGQELLRLPIPNRDGATEMRKNFVLSKRDDDFCHVDTLISQTWSERWKVGRPGRLWISHTRPILWQKPLLQCLLPPHYPTKRDGKTPVLFPLHRQIRILKRPRFCRAPRRLDFLSECGFKSLNWFGSGVQTVHCTMSAPAYATPSLNMRTIS